MDKKVKELLNEKIGTSNVSLANVLDNGIVSGYTPVETGDLNGQYCKLVASGAILTIAQIENFWKYVDASLKLCDWIFLVGAQVRFDNKFGYTGIDKLLKKDINDMVHCKVIADTFRKSADEWRESMDETIKSGVATREEVEEYCEKIRFMEIYKTPNRNSYQLLMENYKG